jgi:hypothetical protein
VRDVKIRAAVNAYDPCWHPYLEQRAKSPHLRTRPHGARLVRSYQSPRQNEACSDAPGHRRVPHGAFVRA